MKISNSKRAFIRKYFKGILRIIRPMRNYLINKKFGEKSCTYGSLNEDIIFYVIRRSTSKVGLFSNTLVFLEHIKYAVEKGYYPIIDMKNYPNAYLTEGEIGKVNTWEYFFKQPFDKKNQKKKTLDEVYQSKNVILCNGNRVDGERIDFSPNFVKNPKAVNMWKKYYQEYIHINEKEERLIDDEFKSLFSPLDKILGVSVRGTDYVKLRPFGHPIQPDITTLLETTDEKMSAWGCNTIFLCTEDVEIVEEFKVKFGDKIRMNQRLFYETDSGDTYTPGRGFDRENDRYLTGLEYLTSIVILSRCQCIIGSFASGFNAAILMSKGFEEEFYWDLGLYGINDQEGSENK